VVPKAPRWPSWKTHTSAPKAAVNDKTFITNAFSGKTTLPVRRNSRIRVTTAMIDSTTGSLDVTASELSRLICAHPVSWTARPPGVATACSRSSCVREASEFSRAVLLTVRNALPSFHPVGVDGGPTRAPSTNVPLGADTAETSCVRDRSVA
jgi:hypothetical protein